ncbi:MAG: hypothetical protein HQL94_01640 [Magnetococcales bacterium]|nr:hypothetical protein [Magnetococcales bacterium]
MYQLIPYGISSFVGYLLGKKLFASEDKPPSDLSPLRGHPSIQIVAEQILTEDPVVLATEEIPLDNRFGNKLLSSEHEFARTATVAMKLDRGSKLVSDFKSSLLDFLETRTQLELGKSIGVSAGAEITRRIRLKFAVDPGRFVLYRVVWKQTSRRGIFEIMAGGKMVEVPYLATYGLTHVVESVQHPADPGGPGLKGNEADWE